MKFLSNIWHLCSSVKSFNKSVKITSYRIKIFSSKQLIYLVMMQFLYCYYHCKDCQLTKSVIPGISGCRSDCFRPQFLNITANLPELLIWPKDLPQANLTTVVSVDMDYRFIPKGFLLLVPQNTSFVSVSMIDCCSADLANVQLE